MCELEGDAVMAEEAGFDFAAVSDHFHPWIEGTRLCSLPEEAPPVMVAASGDSRPHSPARSVTV
ncbi:MAG: hypothetical protein ACXWZF_12690 [Actinomycetota bacterium]